MGGGAAVTAGASAAKNYINNTAAAMISGSSVISHGGVELTANSESTIWAMTIAATGGGSGGAGGGFSINGAGSGSINTIDNRTEASITNTSTVTTFGGDIVLTADEFEFWRLRRCRWWYFARWCRC
jgi:hypothetical protein